MKWKITSQAVAEQMAKEMGITKRSAEQFTHIFIDTLEEGLQRDGVVKIKGFGTFKMVSINSRESVNVTTGERMVIAEHKKVSFTPAEEITVQLTNLVSHNDASQTSPEQQKPSIKDTTISLEESPSTQPNNISNFDGIDDIIATPESEMLPTDNDSLGSHQEEVNSSSQPSLSDDHSVPTSNVSKQDFEDNGHLNEASEQQQNVREQKPASNEQKNENNEFHSDTQKPSYADQTEKTKKHKKSLLLILFILIIILIGIIAYLVVPIHKNASTNSPQQVTPKVESPKKIQSSKQPSGVQPSDTQSSTKTPQDTIAESQPSRPKTYILKKGQSITDVSVLFYGTKDSMQAIIRANNFRNPNNVYVGTEIKLP